MRRPVKTRSYWIWMMNRAQTAARHSSVVLKGLCAALVLSLAQKPTAKTSQILTKCFTGKCTSSTAPGPPTCPRFSTVLKKISITSGSTGRNMSSLTTSSKADSLWRKSSLCCVSSSRTSIRNTSRRARMLSTLLLQNLHS